jgi:ArsR family transcriptional regulator
MLELLNIFKIMSDETRLRILLLLYHHDLCVCQLSGILDASQPKISKNLSKLRDLNIVHDERKEKFVYYSLNRDNTPLLSILATVYEQSASNSQFIFDQQRLENRDLFVTNCSTNR